jgi:hypothetical protein
MSLIKKQSMTDKNLAAHQRNGRLARGAATAEGKERSRAAHLRHGFYSQGREEALRALGEDPAELAALIEAAHEEWRPTNAFQGHIAERLARLLWRMERAERMQESLAARQMRQHEKHRKQVALELRYKVVPQIDILDLLEENAADPRFYTPRGYFQSFCQAFGDKAYEEQKEILELMHRLRKPKDHTAKPRKGAANPASRGPTPDPEGGVLAPAPLPGPSPASRVPSPGPEDGTAVAEEPPEDIYLRDLAQMDADDFPLPWPRLAVAEGAERDELRGELVRRARNELDLVHAAWDPQIQEHEAPLSRLDQDQVLAEPHRHAELMQREEQSCFRQFVRLGNFLMKFQDHAAKYAENEGSTGYVDENAGGEQTDLVANCPEPVAPRIESEVRSQESGVETESPSEVGAAADQETVGSVGSGLHDQWAEVGIGSPSEGSQAAAQRMRPEFPSRIPDKARSEAGT